MLGSTVKRLGWSVALAAAFGTSASMAAVSIKYVEGTDCSASPAVIAIPATAATRTVSVCVVTTASERVCGATYSILSTNAAANAAGVQITARTPSAPFTNIQDLTIFPATLSNTATILASATPASGFEPGVVAANVKIAELTLAIPAGLPASTSFSYAVDAAGEVATTTAADCNNLDVFQTSNPPGSGGFVLETPTPPQTVTVSVAPASVSEEGGILTYTFTRTGTAAQIAASLSVNITPPAASARYTTTCVSPIGFAAAATTATCTVTGVGNINVDGNVTASVAITAGPGYTAGAPSSATGTITDDDGPQTVTIAVAPASVSEASGTPLVYTVTRSGGSAAQQAAPLIVNLSGTGTAATSRYSTTCASTITIAGGSSTATCSVTPIDNTNVDASVTAVVSIAVSAAYTTGTPSSATGTITDDDGPQTVTIAVAPATVAENSGTSLVYTVTRSGGSAAQQAAPLIVNLTGPAASSRYSTTCASTITIAGGSTTATCSVTPIDNSTIDGSVTAVVSIAASAAYTTGSPASATGTITDDDVAVQAVAGATGTAASSSVVEGGLVVFSVACPVNPTPTTFNYTVTPALTTGDAFTTGSSSGSVTCPAAGGNVVAVGIQTINDTTIGNNRTYTFTISVPATPVAVVITRASATFAVLDNDQPTQIPTLGVFGLGLMGLLLAGFGALVQRRRKA